MKTRTPLAILAATAITGLGLTALATPANANKSVDITGDTDNPIFTPNSVTGTSFTMTNTLGGYVHLLEPSILDGNGDPCPTAEGTDTCKMDSAETSTFSIAPGTNGVDVLIATSNQGSLTGLFTVTYVGESGPSNDSASGSTPAPRIQQFEKPATGTCDEAQPEGLNWGGASSGGWGESWDQWVNEGQGGAVCTRTLAYNNSTGTWQVQ